jgi:NitT/TauT family transport system ATP-binding protein
MAKLLSDYRPGKASRSPDIEVAAATGGFCVGEVSLVNVSKNFTVREGGVQQTFRALNSVSFSIADGEVVVLIGPSGCGKTTALRIVMGLESASSGRITVDGKVITGCGHDRGLVFQHAELLPWLNAVRNVEFGLEMKGLRGQELRETALSFLDLVGLREAAGRYPHQLSGGMKQRVGIARALAINPQVLLMDEPFGALDAQTRESLQGELIDLQARTGKTVLFVTHDLDEAVVLADRIIVMAGGEIREELEVPIPRESRKLAEVRGSAAFSEIRYSAWKSLHSAAGTAH